MHKKITLKQQSTHDDYDVSEQLTQPMPAVHDTRPIVIKPAQKLLIPQYNELYDTLRTTKAWRYCADMYAKGTITTVANALATASVSFAQTPVFRTSQWPGAVQLYLVIRQFSLAPQSTISAVGALDCYFIDQFGNTAPLGDYVSSSGNNVGFDTLLTTPITDPENSTNVGQLQVTLTGTTPTTSVYNWQIGFSVAYLLPAKAGYSIHHEEQTEVHHVTHHS